MSVTVEQKLFTKTAGSRQGVYYLGVGLAALVLLLLMVYRGPVNLTDYFFMLLTFGIFASALIRLVVIHKTVLVGETGVTVGNMVVTWEEMARINFGLGRRAIFTHIEIISKNPDRSGIVIYPGMLRNGEQLESLLTEIAQQKEIATN